MIKIEFAAIILVFCILLTVSIYKKPFLKAKEDEKFLITIKASIFILITSSLFIFVLGNNKIYAFVKQLAENITGTK